MLLAHFLALRLYRLSQVSDSVQSGSTDNGSISDGGRSDAEVYMLHAPLSSFCLEGSGYGEHIQITYIILYPILYQLIQDGGKNKLNK